MKKPLVIAIAGLVLAACGGEDVKDPDNNPDVSKSVDYDKLEMTPLSEEGLVLAEESALLQHINNGLRIQVSQSNQNFYRADGEFVAVPGAPAADGGAGGDASGGDGSSGDGFSETNVHVDGVDEADYAKYDGRYWYIATEASGGLNINDRQPGLKIYSTDPATPSAELLSKTPLDDDWGAAGEIYTVTQEEATTHIASIRNQWGNIYPMLPGRGIAIDAFMIDVPMAGGGAAVSSPGAAETGEGDAVSTSSATEPAAPIAIDEDGERVAADLIWPGPQNSKIRIDLVNVEDPYAPAKESRIEIDGSLIQSRKVGNMLYLVSRYEPWLSGIAYEYGDLSVRENNELAFKAADIEDLFPKYRIADTEAALSRDCYIQAGMKEEFGLTSLVHITAIDLASKTIVDSECLNSNVEALSMSPQSLYLTGSVYGNDQRSTIIHKFSLSDQGLNYSASGRVEGTVSWRSDPAFRMHEYGDQFRIVTSDWTELGPIHHLSILRDEGGKLALQSTLPNEANPEPIGKPQEDIYSVRFEGEKAYIVTFQRTDPLYAIDLSDPLNPFVAGELEIPGFATYLHPVGEDYLFTFGQDADENGRTRGLKAELIDVSGVPEVVSSFLLGDTGSYSVALKDLRAFSFQSAGQDAMRVAIPVRLNELDENGARQSMSTGVQLFTISGLGTAAEMNNSGFIAIDSESLAYYQRGRTVLHDDAVFINFANDVWTAPWFNPTEVKGPVKGGPIACTAEFRMGLKVSVDLTEGNEDGVTACDAVVNIFDNEYRETLQASDSDDPLTCDFHGAGERAGFYSIEVDAKGYTPGYEKVTVYEDDCHVITEEVSVQLRPQELTFCTTEARPSIRLEVMGDLTAASPYVCDARVYVEQDGEIYPLDNFAYADAVPTPVEDGSSELVAPPRPEMCTYQGPYELGGEMTLVVEHPDYQTVREGLFVPQGECHVETQQIHVQLEMN